MAKKKTLEEFIADAIKKHGDKYDYSLIKEYVNSKTKVPIKCNRCGNVFWQKPNDHLNGRNCSHCWNYNRPQFSKRKILFGRAILDVDFSINQNKETSCLYKTWKNMFERCYSNSDKFKPYLDCTVCDEWCNFYSFYNWCLCNGFKVGYQLDKDILAKGNRVYSPKTCCFVPREINAFVNNQKNRRGNLPLGVTLSKCGKFTSKIHKFSTNKHIVIGTFDTPEDAFYAYKIEKEKFIREIATKYYNEEKITKKVYDSLLNYKIEITD